MKTISFILWCNHCIYNPNGIGFVQAVNVVKTYHSCTTNRRQFHIYDVNLTEF